MRAIPIEKDVHITFMNLVAKADGDIIVMGFDNGDIHLVCNFNFDKRMSIKYHDGQIGSITGAVFNHEQNYFITVATDGLTIVHEFDKVATIEESKFDPLEGVEGVQFLPKEEKEALAEKRLKDFQTEKKAVF